MNPHIHKFLLELLHDAGQTGLTPDIENLMIEDLAVRLEDRLMLILRQHLTPEQEREVQKMVGEGKNQEMIMEYLKSTTPEFEKIVSQAMLDFRELYIEASKGE